MGKDETGISLGQSWMRRAKLNHKTSKNPKEGPNIMLSNSPFYLDMVGQPMTTVLKRQEDPKSEAGVGYIMEGDCLKTQETTASNKTPTFI